MKKWFNIRDNKLRSVFISDISTGSTIEQEVKFVFQDIWTERACFIQIFRFKAFIYARFTKSQQQSNQGVCKLLSRGVVEILFPCRTDLNMWYVENMSLSDIFVLHSGLKRCIIFFLPDGRKKSNFIILSTLCPNVLKIIRFETFF